MGRVAGFAAAFGLKVGCPFGTVGLVVGPDVARTAESPAFVVGATRCVVGVRHKVTGFFGAVATTVETVACTVAVTTGEEDGVDRVSRGAGRLEDCFN